jgi:serralysin
MADDNATRNDIWCFAWYQEALAATPETKAALLEEKRWTARSKIRIGFMDGTPDQKALVRKFAEGWVAPGLANLQFSWESVDVADIRISFAGMGSWSVIGTTCKNVPKAQPTMNFGWLIPGVTAGEGGARHPA